MAFLPWSAEWREPPLTDRPLQIVHGIHPERASPDGMRYYTNLGLGGIVCNVAFQQYLKSEAHWKTLVEGVQACEKLGMTVWLYDEQGYPSGAAGGEVLAEDKTFEACELAFDVLRDNPFLIRPCYEFTHACNNYFASRRYINILDERAVACFLRKTHEAYRRNLERRFGRTITAFFTDEPSLMAVNLGSFPEDLRRKLKIPVVDQPDTNLLPLPRVPWAADLPRLYQERYQQDLNAQRKSLFCGDTAADRQVRRQFWQLIAELVSERYYGQIQQWCRRHKIASSGHTLAEESLLFHVPLDGNKLKALGRMDIPGLDMLTSAPEIAVYSGWMAAAMPFSAAMLQGRRRVMTEVSDHSQKITGQDPAVLNAMEATAAWQAAWGVTEFTLYYCPDDRSADDYRAYCLFVGRLNAALKPATPQPEVLLYYPIFDLWSEYRPVAEPLRIDLQSPRAQRIIHSFMRLGTALVQNQIPFVVIDHEMLAAAEIADRGKLSIGGHKYSTLVFPDSVEPPDAVGVVVRQFRQGGGSVLSDGAQTPLNSAALSAEIKPKYRLLPPSNTIVLSCFLRDGKPLLLLVNVGKQPYQGRLLVPERKTWYRLDPCTGNIGSLETDAQGGLPLPLSGYQTMILLGQ